MKQPVSLLDLPRNVPDVPWAYLKVAEGCDRACRVLRNSHISGHAAIADAGVDRA